MCRSLKQIQRLTPSFFHIEIIEGRSGLLILQVVISEDVVVVHPHLVLRGISKISPRLVLIVHLCYYKSFINLTFYISHDI
jgi:hypothetical protein